MKSKSIALQKDRNSILRLISDQHLKRNRKARLYRRIGEALPAIVILSSVTSAVLAGFELGKSFVIVASSIAALAEGINRHFNFKIRAMYHRDFALKLEKLQYDSNKERLTTQDVQDRYIELRNEHLNGLAKAGIYHSKQDVSPS